MMSISAIRKDKSVAFLIITMCLAGFSYALMLTVNYLKSIGFVANQWVVSSIFLLFPLLYYLVSNELIKGFCPNLLFKHRLKYILILPFIWLAIIVGYLLFVTGMGISPL
jgi:hypothetical protein